ncbi:MAG TPA: hypothetical protein VHP81_02005, partial [Lachnospiraceae bacterium]|nr:hypothetical protein [Lachnospiraceae bacterium]
MWEVSNAGFLSYLLNAFVWCTGIMVQALLEREAFNKDLFLEVFASFLFSIGIGYVYMRSVGTTATIGIRNGNTYFNFSFFILLETKKDNPNSSTLKANPSR